MQNLWNSGIANKTQTRNKITLKFGTHKGSPKANSSIKFGTNLMNG